MIRKILVVDDSNVIQQIYREYLSRYQSTEVLLAPNGAEALDTLSLQPDVDLIFLDVNMPVMNGLEFLVRLKHEPAHKDIPVIVVSTRGSEVDEQRCLDLGARGFLQKPFEIPQLYQAIEQTARPRASF
jgi:CheY-like chemotaxis protein